MNVQDSLKIHRLVSMDEHIKIWAPTVASSRRYFIASDFAKATTDTMADKERKLGKSMIHKSGFSLIELVVGTLLTAMLSTVLFNAFYQSNRTLVLTDEYTDIDTNEVTVLYQMERDISGIILLPIVKENKDQKQQPQQLEQPTENKKKEEPPITKNFFCTTKENGRLDLLTFLTVNPRALHNGKPRLVRVVYRLNKHTDKKESFVLTRQEIQDLNFEAAEQKGEKRPRELIVSNNIKQCNVEFIYTATTQTEDKKKPESKKVLQWDSDKGREKEKLPPLPSNVILALTVWDDAEKVSRSITYHMPIYSYEQALIADQKKEEPAASADAKASDFAKATTDKMADKQQNQTPSNEQVVPQMRRPMQPRNNPPSRFAPPRQNSFTNRYMRG